MKMSEIQIAVLGCGTIGTGVVKNSLSQAKLIKRRLGVGLRVKKVVEVDPSKGRDLMLPEGVLTPDIGEVWKDEDIQVVVELIGGVTVAREFILKAIECGKHVVTANKALLAKHGREIFALAGKKNVQVRFEASVGGGIPVIKSMMEGFSANRVKEVCGIINGTCNYILTRMRTDGLSFENALSAAQKKGYAEADPTLDINGTDSAHKIAVLASIADGSWVNFGDVHIEGIQDITLNDIKFAEEIGYGIKLLGILRNYEDDMDVRVHPAIISLKSPLARIDGEYNAIFVEGDVVGSTMFYGKGAGADPTSSAVLSDVMDIGRDIARQIDRQTVEYFDCQKQKKIRDMDELVCTRYLRVMATDRPGVLSEITGILGAKGISIETVLQKEKFPGGIVPVILVTHRSREKDMREALEQIGQLASVKGNPVMIREHIV